MTRPASQQQHVPHSRHLFIGGEWVEPSTKDTIKVIDSATEEVFLKVAEAKAADVERAVATARHAFDHGPWPRMSPVERASYLEKIADGLAQHADALADTWTAEAGVLRSIAQYAHPLMSGAFKYYASLGQSFAWQEQHTSANGRPALLVREPVGVVLAIIPWNGASSLLAYKVAPALIAGCSVIIKAAPEAPASAYIFAKVCEEIGLPKGVVNVITADREVSELAVRHPGVDKVSFTGSTAAGRKIASACGERIARFTLELGGKSPAVILDDYDVEKAAEAISRFAPMLTGQVCSALTRIIVSEKRHDDMVEALSAKFSRIKIGDPFAAETEMGPLAMARQRDRVESYIARGRADGARLAAGGARPAHLNRGFYIEPTVFGNVDNRSVIAQEEIFGPVLCVIPAANEETAVEIANDTIFGLNSSVFTNDPERAYAVGRKIRAGTVSHNAFENDFTIAFGGFKQSGVGREGGVEGLHPYLETKTMLFDERPRTLN